MARVFKTKSRAEWTEVFGASDACVTPVLSMGEVMEHPHNVARGVLVREVDVEMPAPAPRFARTPSAISAPPPLIGEHSGEILSDWGFDETEIRALKEDGHI